MSVDTGPYDPDPFTQVYDALWAALRNFAPVTQVVLALNQIDHTREAGAENFPYEDQESLNDTNLLRLDPDYGEFDLHTHPDTSEVEIRFSLMIMTTEERLNLMFFPLLWNCMRAVTRVGHDLGLDFVQNTRIERFDSERDDGDQENQANWRGSLSILVTMSFDKTDLTEDA